MFRGGEKTRNALQCFKNQTNFKKSHGNVIGCKADSFSSSSISSRCVWENQCKIYIVRTMGFFILVSSAV